MTPTGENEGDDEPFSTPMRQQSAEEEAATRQEGKKKKKRRLVKGKSAAQEEEGVPPQALFMQQQAAPGGDARRPLPRDSNATQLARGETDESAAARRERANEAAAGQQREERRTGQTARKRARGDQEEGEDSQDEFDEAGAAGKSTRDKDDNSDGSDSDGSDANETGPAAQARLMLAECLQLLRWMHETPNQEITPKTFELGAFHEKAKERERLMGQRVNKILSNCGPKSKATGKRDALKEMLPELHRLWQLTGPYLNNQESDAPPPGAPPTSGEDEYEVATEWGKFLVPHKLAGFSSGKGSYDSFKNGYEDRHTLHNTTLREYFIRAMKDYGRMRVDLDQMDDQLFWHDVCDRFETVFETVDLMKTLLKQCTIEPPEAKRASRGRSVAGERSRPQRANEHDDAAQRIRVPTLEKDSVTAVAEYNASRIALPPVVTKSPSMAYRGDGGDGDESTYAEATAEAIKYVSNFQNRGGIQSTFIQSNVFYRNVQMVAGTKDEGFAPVLTTASVEMGLLVEGQPNVLRIRDKRRETEIAVLHHQDSYEWGAAAAPRKANRLELPEDADAKQQEQKARAHEQEELNRLDLAGFCDERSWLAAKVAAKQRHEVAALQREADRCGDEMRAMKRQAREAMLKKDGGTLSNGYDGSGDYQEERAANYALFLESQDLLRTGSFTELRAPSATEMGNSTKVRELHKACDKMVAAGEAQEQRDVLRESVAHMGEDTRLLRDCFGATADFSDDERLIVPLSAAEKKDGWKTPPSDADQIRECGTAMQRLQKACDEMRKREVDRVPSELDLAAHAWAAWVDCVESTDARGAKWTESRKQTIALIDAVPGFCERIERDIKLGDGDSYTRCLTVFRNRRNELRDQNLVYTPEQYPRFTHAQLIVGLTLSGLPPDGTRAECIATLKYTKPFLEVAQVERLCSALRASEMYRAVVLRFPRKAFMTLPLLSLSKEVARVCEDPDAERHFRSPGGGKVEYGGRVYEMPKDPERVFLGASLEIYYDPVDKPASEHAPSADEAGSSSDDATRRRDRAHFPRELWEGRYKLTISGKDAAYTLFKKGSGDKWDVVRKLSASTVVEKVLSPRRWDAARLKVHQKEFRENDCWASDHILAAYRICPKNDGIRCDALQRASCGQYVEVGTGTGGLQWRLDTILQAWDPVAGSGGDSSGMVVNRQLPNLHADAQLLKACATKLDRRRLRYHATTLAHINFSNMAKYDVYIESVSTKLDDYLNEDKPSSAYFAARKDVKQQMDDEKAKKKKKAKDATSASAAGGDGGDGEEAEDAFAAAAGHAAEDEGGDQEAEDAFAAAAMGGEDEAGEPPPPGPPPPSAPPLAGARR